MQAYDIVLNLHGEAVSSPGITVLNAEREFIPTLHKLHKAFPSLRIILEHVSTREGIEAVRRCGATVFSSLIGSCIMDMS